jgi:hypothetical protein
MPANLTTKLGQLVDVLTPDTTNTRIGVANASPTRTLDVTGTFGASGASTLGGALTYGGVTLSNAVTGTGNMVLSASPTLTGTLTAATVTASGRVTGSTGGTFGPTVSGGSAVTTFISSDNSSDAIALEVRQGRYNKDTLILSTNQTNSANFLNVIENGSSKFTISTNGNTAITGNVGIGMTPSNILDITQNTSGTAIASILNNSASTTAATEYRVSNGTHYLEMVMYGTGFGSSGLARADGARIVGEGAGGLTLDSLLSQPIYFGINGSEKARIGTDGSLLVGTTTNAGAGVISANAGVIVAASQSTLANYTTGSWTPTDVSGASISFSAASGRYVRIGNIVHLMAVIVWPVTASSVGVLIGGLPFTSGDYYFGVLNTNGTAGSQAYTIAGQAQLTYCIAANTSALLNSTQSGASTRLTIVYAV